MKAKHFIIGQLVLIVSISMLIIGSGGWARPIRATKSVAQMNDLTNVDQLKQAFERDRGKVRIVSLLSPV